MSVYIGVVSTYQTPSGGKSLSTFREIKGFYALKVSVFFQQGPCDNSLTAKCGPDFIKRILPLSFAKALTFVCNAHMVQFTDNGFFPHQCRVLSLEIALLTIIKVIVINQCHFHYLYLSSVTSVLGTGKFYLHNFTATLK